MSAQTILNLANCSTQGNTGGTFCNVEPSYILYAFAVPKGTVIPATALASQSAFVAYVKSALWNNSKSARWQMTPKLVDFKDNTKEPTMENLDGYENTTQWLPYDWEFRFANGFSGATKNVHQIWRQYINQQQNIFDFFFVDANNVWIGTQGLDGTGAQGLASVAVSNITINDYKPATVKTGNIYTLHLIIQNNQDLNANYQAVNSMTATSSFKALTDVNTKAGTTTSSQTNIYVSGMIGGNTLGKQYGTTLASASAWVILDTTTGTKTFTISGVTYDAVNDQYNIAGTWSASSTGDTISVGLATPSVMTVTPFFANIVTEGNNIYNFVTA